MADASTLQALLTRVEAAGAPDREIDADLWWVLRHDRAERLFNTGALGMPKGYPATLPIPAGLGRAAVQSYAPNYTASLDAVLELAPKVGARPIYLLAGALKGDADADLGQLARLALTALLRALASQAASEVAHG